MPGGKAVDLRAAFRIGWGVRPFANELDSVVGKNVMPTVVDALLNDEDERG